MKTITNYICHSRWIYTALALATFALPWMTLDDELNPTSGLGLLPNLVSQVGHNPDRSVLIALGLCLLMYGAAALFWNARFQHKTGAIAAFVVAVAAGLLPFLSGPVVQHPYIGWGATVALFALVSISSAWNRMHASPAHASRHHQ